ncbi:hypothetical protein Ahy_B06g080400 isoform C [Arachis hypogaea]|uniref:Uncharacterized protein n=1 Tax=Arachis hypogaea TaxID=3818 RepID=A0A444YI07_ARAHY|nr:hypothetical protein Ahy_B06g080400 isoform C [Arachis hypogaea]
MVLYDKKTGTNLLQWPVEEIESLRLSSDEFKELLVKPGTVVPLHIGPATQDFSILDIFFGPFGILAIANDQLSELTPIYFCLSNYGNGTSTTTTITTSTSTSFCVDETRSLKAPDVSKLVFGSKLPILSDEKLSLKVLLFEAKKRERAFTNRGRRNQLRSMGEAKNLLQYMFNSVADVRCSI